MKIIRCVTLMNVELITKAEAIARNAEVASIANVDDKGYPRVSTISNLKTDGLRKVWFATGLGSSKVKFLERTVRRVFATATAETTSRLSATLRSSLLLNLKNNCGRIGSSTISQAAFRTRTTAFCSSPPKKSFYG